MHPDFKHYNHSYLLFINLFLLIYASALYDRVSILFLSEIFLIECIPYYFFVNILIVYVLFVHKKSVSKRKICIIFIKNEKLKKNPKNPKTHIFSGVFWVGFLLPTLPGSRGPTPPPGRCRPPPRSGGGCGGCRRAGRSVWCRLGSPSPCGIRRRCCRMCLLLKK